ncbi:glycosyltransferase family 4 protein [Oceanidesulfovibrio marinus]|nr:MraY family glycosyltransferase [Oceanidesulfovibrio marinus]
MRKAPGWGFMCQPGGHSCHNGSVPLLGGAAIYCAVLLSFLLFFLVFSEWPPGFMHPDYKALFSLLIGTTWIAALGTLDDRRHMDWHSKLLGELVGIAILLIGGHTIQNATLPFVGVVHFGWFGQIFFALSVLTITNAVNLIDGLDGLAGGICFFAALVSGIIGLLKGDIFMAVIGFGVSGGLLAFLRYNFPPASVFMGDGGSLMLGFLLSTLATSSAATSPGQRSGMMTMILVPFMPFGIALLDVSFAIIRRSISGRRIFQPDTDHIHHRLMEALGRPRRVVALLYLFSALLSALTLAMVLGPRHELYRIYIILIGILALGLVILLLRLYTRESLPRILGNRAHMKYLASFSDFMCRRLQRVSTEYEALTLLQRGVCDLDFDTVRVEKYGSIYLEWTREQPLHPDAPRSEREWSLGNGVIVRWTMPKHESESYQNYLLLTWNQLLKSLSRRLPKLRGGC